MKIHSHPVRLYVAGLSLALAGVIATGVQAAPGGPGMAGHGTMMAQGPMGGPGGHGGHGGPGVGMFDGMMSRMLDRVNATPEQRTQIQQIMQNQASEMRAQREAGRALRQQAMALFAQPTVDATAVEALRQKQLAMHDAASKRMTAAMLRDQWRADARAAQADGRCHEPAQRDDAAPPARAPGCRSAEELTLRQRLANPMTPGLPRAGLFAPAPQGTGAFSLCRTMNERLLLIDDDARLGAMVGDYLRGHGFEVDYRRLAGGRARRAQAGPLRRAAARPDAARRRRPGADTRAACRRVMAPPAAADADRARRADRPHRRPGARRRRLPAQALRAARAAGAREGAAAPCGARCRAGRGAAVRPAARSTWAHARRGWMARPAT